MCYFNTSFCRVNFLARIPRRQFNHAVSKGFFYTPSIHNFPLQLYIIWIYVLVEVTIIMRYITHLKVCYCIDVFLKKVCYATCAGHLWIFHCYPHIVLTRGPKFLSTALGLVLVVMMVRSNDAGGTMVVMHGNDDHIEMVTAHVNGEYNMAWLL